MAYRENDEKLASTRAFFSPANELDNLAKPRLAQVCEETTVEPELAKAMVEAMNHAFRAAGPVRIRCSL